MESFIRSKIVGMGDRDCTSGEGGDSRQGRGENREVEGGSAFKLSGSESRCPSMLGGG